MAVAPTLSRAAAFALAFALPLVAGCGSSGTSGTGAEATGRPHSAGRALTAERLRDAVMLGVARDFRAGTGVGPPNYATCVRARLRHALTKSRLELLISVGERPAGQQFAAQALNRLAAPIGDLCGGRRFVPELVAASEALAGKRLVESRAERLGLAYGPFLGVSCPRPSSVGCDRVGIDLVLRRPARAVTATLGGRRISLVSPGPVPHGAGAGGRDWGGFLEHAGLSRPGPFHVRSSGTAVRHWAGSPPLYVPVRLAIGYRQGGRRIVNFPRVFVSPGFG